MQNLRKYGNGPFRVALIHGGPGAAGEMAPVARELAGEWGVLEPLQTAETLEGQVAELRAVLEEEAHGPVTLVGFSWGAWLGVILAARFPGLVEKLILVGCAPFHGADARGIYERRLGRLTAQERADVVRLLPGLKDPIEHVRNQVFRRFGTLFSRVDAFDPMESDRDELICSADIYNGVWPEADALRQSGELLETASMIGCPVVAIHGDYDPHPAHGVRDPLARCLADFRFVLLARCGHKPWVERQAGAEFYEVLKAELNRE